MYVERVETKRGMCVILSIWLFTIALFLYYFYILLQLPSDDQAYLRGNDAL